MKSVIVISIGLVLLLLLSIFSQLRFGGESGEGLNDFGEDSVGELNDLQNRVETLENNLDRWISLQFYVFVGIIVEVIGIALIMVYWSKIPPIAEYRKWWPENRHLFDFNMKTASEFPEVKFGEPSAYILLKNVRTKVSGDHYENLYVNVPKSFNDTQRWQRKIPISILVLFGFLLQLIQFL